MRRLPWRLPAPSRWRRRSSRAAQVVRCQEGKLVKMGPWWMGVLGGVCGASASAARQVQPRARRRPRSASRHRFGQRWSALEGSALKLWTKPSLLRESVQSAGDIAMQNPRIATYKHPHEHDAPARIQVSKQALQPSACPLAPPSAYPARAPSACPAYPLPSALGFRRIEIASSSSRRPHRPPVSSSPP